MGRNQARYNLVRYNKVKKASLLGMTFDSKAESHFYLWLKAREQAGEIANIKHQVPVVLLDGPVKMKRTYKCDFSFEENGETIYAEVKGFETDRWKSNLLLWRHIGPGVLRIYRLDWDKLFLHEEVVPDDSYLRKRLGLNL